MKLSLALLVIGVALCAICANQNTLVLAQAPANVEGDLTNAQSGSPSNYERGWVTYNGPGGVTYKGQGEFPVRGLKDTLTKVGSTVAKTFGALSVVSDIFSGVKLVASFFKTKYKTETNENYWEELSETASAMVEEAIDHMILRQTQDAVKRMSENLEFYIDNNSTVGDFSFLDLNMAMDNERETIMSMYAGINHAENVVLQYLDMVTTRLMLWQATALRYISDYTIAGKAPSGDSVCSIVYKWNMAYRTEIDDIHDFLLPALAKWNTDYKDKMDISCSATLTDPAFSQWSYVAHCKIFDGYHGKFPKEWDNTCYHKSSPRCPKKSSSAVCSKYCGDEHLTEYKTGNDKFYALIKDHVENMLENFSIMKEEQVDVYMKQCGF